LPKIHSLREKKFLQPLALLVKQAPFVWRFVVWYLTRCSWQ
jgi:hypothetical protein